jgi:arsenate reductase (thioredoxin)
MRTDYGQPQDASIRLYAAAVQQGDPRPIVLFVCRHGAAKSVLAAAELERIAAERGIALSARAAGVEPDDQMSPGVIELLPDLATKLGGERPRHVTHVDVADAALTVTFNLESSELPAEPAERLVWDDVPAVSDDSAAARAAIDRHIADLIESRFARDGRPG